MVMDFFVQNTKTRELNSHKLEQSNKTFLNITFLLQKFVDVKRFVGLDKGNVW